MPDLDPWAPRPRRDDPNDDRCLACDRPGGYPYCGDDCTNP